ncbi:MAG: hypothetical protein ACO29L_00960 [Candidatus Methylopumilus sp.]
MSEIKNGIFKTINKWIAGSSASLAVIYTCGHIIIAMICIKVITGASMNLAAADAIIEPMINGVWFYLLHKTFNKIAARKNENKEYRYA